MTFYVYRLIDPRNGAAFYVGKGQGNRAWVHQRQVEAGLCRGNARKISKIREILISGNDVEVEIVAEYDSEADALDHEYRLVDANPTLTNVMPGGAEGRSISPAQREKRRLARRARIDALRAKERAIKAGIWEQRQKDDLLSRSSAVPHKAEIEDWLAAEKQVKFSEKANPYFVWRAQHDAAAQFKRAKTKAKRLRDRENKKRRLRDAKQAEADSHASP